MNSSAIVALVGRPNVGKSTLFNRLTRRKASLVNETEHTTRDVKFGTWEVANGEYLLVDTCGLGLTDSIAVQAAQQRSMDVLREAGCIVLVTNSRDGWSADDRELLEVVRRTGRPYVVVANKTDSGGDTVLDAGFYESGEEILAISGLHGLGLVDLEDAVSNQCQPTPVDLAEEVDEAAMRMSIVGRPNVGKSTLFNRLLGESRSVVSSEAGTTMDVVEEAIPVHGVRCTLIDTAGARRQKKVSQSLETAAVQLAMEAIRRSHYVVVVLNAEEGLTHQDLKIIQYAWERNRAMLLVANRIDLSPHGEDWKAKIENDIDRMMPQVGGVPLVAVSALTGRHAQRVLPTIEKLVEQASMKVRTSDINKWVEKAQREHPPRLVSKGAHRNRKRPKFFYGVQVRSQPITIRMYCNFPNDLTANYHRYLVGSFKKEFGLDLVPIAFEFERGRAKHA